MELRQDLQRRLNEILRADNPPFGDAQILNRLRGWDSIRYMKLLMSLEKDLNIRFEAFEVARLNTWGEFVALVGQKTK